MSTSQRVSRGFHRLAVLLAGALMLTASPAIPDEAKARLGRVMWTAFECATFAGMADKGEEAKRLSDTGLKAGRDFTEALKSGAISKEEVDSTVPWLVVMLANEGVPSTDFFVGRVYHAANEAPRQDSKPSAAEQRR